MKKKLFNRFTGQPVEFPATVAGDLERMNSSTFVTERDMAIIIATNEVEKKGVVGKMAEGQSFEEAMGGAKREMPIKAPVGMVYNREQLESMKFPELRELASEAGLKFKPGTKKSEAIDQILAL